MKLLPAIFFALSIFPAAAKDASAVAFLKGLHDIENDIGNHMRPNDPDATQRAFSKQTGPLSRLHWEAKIGAPTSTYCIGAQSALMGMAMDWKNVSPASAQTLKLNTARWFEFIEKCEAKLGLRQVRRFAP